MFARTFNHGDIVFYLNSLGSVKKVIFSETWESGFSYIINNKNSELVLNDRLFLTKSEAFYFYLNELIELKKFYKSLVYSYDQKINALDIKTF